MAEPEYISPTDFSSLLIRSYELAKQNQSLGMALTDPYIRNSLKYVYPLFIFLHACVSVVGIAGNSAIIVIIIRRGLYRNPTFFFIANLALSDLVKAAIVAPITLTNLLLQNFIFGSFMCYFLPMMHSIPIHASMLTYTMLAVDRCRFIVHPMKSRVPAGLCTMAVWVISVCVVLPYAVYINYIDLMPLLGVDLGLCMINHDRHIEEYIRSMFVIFYCLPLAVITFLYVKISMELKTNESTTVTLHIADRPSVSEATYQSHLTWPAEGDDEPDDASIMSQHSRISFTGVQNGRNGVDDDDMDMRKERRTQKYLMAMVTLFATCWFPITILILVTHFVLENDDNRLGFDITYLTFTFFGYLSTCINPVLFASWRMSDRTKNRLKGYFRFNNKRSHSSLSRMSEITLNQCGNSRRFSTSQRTTISDCDTPTKSGVGQ